MALVEIRNLTKVFPQGESVFGGGKSEVRAVDDVSLDIHAGETLGLVGESGSGKSTLGRLTLRLIEPTSGEVRFDSRDLLGASRRELRHLRRYMQIIFQDPFSSLDPRMRVENLVAEPLIIHRCTGQESTGEDARASISRKFAGTTSRDLGDTTSRDFGGTGALTRTKIGIQEEVGNLLKAVGLDSSAMRRYPHEFSGGQRQRIAIARALALRPKFMVCDEAVSALDVSVGAQIVNLLKELQRDFGLTYLFISHSMPVVRYLSTRIAVMYRGKILEVGSSGQITENPQHSYTKSLLDATPELAVQAREE